MPNPYIYKSKLASNKRNTPDEPNNPLPVIEIASEIPHKNIGSTGGNRYYEKSIAEADKICTTPVKKTSSMVPNSSKHTNYTNSQDGTLNKGNIRNQYSLESPPLVHNSIAPFSCERSLFNLSPSDNLYSPFQDKESPPKQTTLCCQKKLFISNATKFKEASCNIEYKVIDSSTKY
jgi:hypothetical protein